MVTGFDSSQEIFSSDVLRSLKSSLKHRCKHVLQPVQLYGDQALPYILQGVLINVSKTGNTKSFSKTQFVVHRTE